MNLKLKERVVIEFLAKEGGEPKEIHNLLKNVYKDAVMDTSNVRHWVKKFERFRFSDLNESRSKTLNFSKMVLMPGLNEAYVQYVHKYVQIDGDYVEL